MDYIVGEKSMLLKSRQDLGERVAQSMIMSHSQQRCTSYLWPLA